MKTHANARLSLKGRELLIDRVERAGWSLVAAAEAGGISDRTARKWIVRHRAEGRDGLLDRSSAPAVVANRTDDRRIEVIAALQAIADDRGGDRRDARHGPLDRVGDPDPHRAGEARPARPGGRPALRARSSGRADPHRRQEARTDRQTGHAVLGGQPARAVKGYHRTRTTAAGSSCTSRSTTQLAWPTSKSSPTRERRPPSGSFAARSSTTPRYGITVERLHHRQRQRLPLNRPRDRLPRPRDPPPPHPPLPTPDQRQGRTVHPHDARRLGLRRHLPRQQPNATPPSPAGSTSTIAADHTAPSATSHPSPASTN